MSRSRYQIYRSKQDIGLSISTLHRENFLAVAILDSGSDDDLRRSLVWYTKNMDIRLHVITLDSRADIQVQRAEWPDVTWIVFSDLPSLGERINAMANECYTTYFAVVRSDMDMVVFDGAKLLQTAEGHDHPAILAPTMVNMSGEIIPTVRVPLLPKRNFISPVSFLPSAGEKTATLYSFMGLGLYDRALFQRMRGYDEEISGEYWQILDYCGRCWLYGYPIYTVPYISLQFVNKQTVIEDTSVQPGANRCLTKLLGVVQKHNTNHIRRFASFLDRDAIETDVRPRLALYKTDFYNLTENWIPPRG